MVRISVPLLFAPLFFALVLSVAAARAETLVGTGARTALDLTLYESGPSLVRDTRTVDLGPAEGRYRFQVIARSMVQTSA